MTVFGHRNTEGRAAPALLLTILGVIDVVAVAAALKALLELSA